MSKSQSQACELTTLADLKADPSNPRRITDEAADGLGVSLQEFGDISGITFNVHTGQLVSGHQRVERLRSLYGDDLPIVDGRIETPDGKAFAVRLVDWDEDTQRRANVAANNQFIAGEFTDDLRGVLADVAEADRQMYESLRLSDLATSYAYDVPEFEPVSADTQGKLDEIQKKTCPNCGYEF